jgi:hypothetical protein
VNPTVALQGHANGSHSNVRASCKEILSDTSSLHLLPQQILRALSASLSTKLFTANLIAKNGQMILIRSVQVILSQLTHSNMMK